jgi:hypothetical protein
MSNNSVPQFRSGFYEGERVLNPPRFVSNADYLATLERLTNESTEQRKRFQRLTPQVEEILNKLDDELKSKIGEHGIAKFREIIKQRRSSRLAAGRQPAPLDKDAIKKLAADKRDTRAKTRAIIAETGVTPSEINNLYAKYSKMIKDLTKPAGEVLKVEDARVLDKSEVPKRVLEATETNQPITKKPPFQYNYVSHYWWYTSVAGPGIDWASYLDWQTGKVGSRVDIWNSDAGEIGNLRVHYDTTMGYYANIPKKGKWNVYLTLTCGLAYANQYFNDESGWFDDSGVESEMYSSISFSSSTMPPVNLANDNPYSAGRWWWSRMVKDSPDGNYTDDPAWEGQDHYYSFTLSDTLPAKNSTFITVGLYDDIDCDLNQYSAYLTWRNRWYIKQVSIDIV